MINKFVFSVTADSGERHDVWFDVDSASSNGPPFNQRLCNVYAEICTAAVNLLTDSDNPAIANQLAEFAADGDKESFAALYGMIERSNAYASQPVTVTVDVGSGKRHETIVLATFKDGLKPLVDAYLSGLTKAATVLSGAHYSTKGLSVLKALTAPSILLPIPKAKAESKAIDKAFEAFKAQAKAKVVDLEGDDVDDLGDVDDIDADDLEVNG